MYHLPFSRCEDPVAALQLEVSSSREVDVFGDANVAHAKSAKPRRIGGGSGWSRLMKACHDHDVALTVIFNELASDIAVNGANCRGLPRTLDLQARTGAEFRNPEGRRAAIAGASVHCV
jgi:hypothetical protein